MFSLFCFSQVWEFHDNSLQKGQRKAHRRFEAHQGSYLTGEMRIKRATSKIGVVEGEGGDLLDVGVTVSSW